MPNDEINQQNLDQIQNPLHASFVIADLKPLINVLTSEIMNPRRKTNLTRTPLQKSFYHKISKLYLQKKRSLSEPTITSQISVDASMSGWGAVNMSEPSRYCSGEMDEETISGSTMILWILLKMKYVPN